MKKFVLCIFTVILAAAAPIFPVFCETGGYVAFGDSIAAGYGLDSPAEAYPSVMAQTLGFRLQNLAKNGQISTELKARIAGLSDAEKRRKQSILIRRASSLLLLFPSSGNPY